MQTLLWLVALTCAVCIIGAFFRGSRAERRLDKALEHRYKEKK